MPDRRKLSIAVVRAVMSEVPENSWVAVTVKDGEVVSVGSTAADALVQARKKWPAVERDQLAILFIGKSRAS